MTTVRVEYHCEADQWWADSVDVEGWVAGAETLEETRDLVKEGLAFFLDVDDLDLLESYAGQPVVSRKVLAGFALGASNTLGCSHAARLVKPFHGQPSRPVSGTSPAGGAPVHA